MSSARAPARVVIRPPCDLDSIFATMTKQADAISRGQKRSKHVVNDPDEVESGCGYKQPKTADGRTLGRDECVCGAVGKFTDDNKTGDRMCSNCGIVKGRIFIDDEVRHLGEDKDGEKGEDKTRTSTVKSGLDEIAQIRAMMEAANKDDFDEENDKDGEKDE